ncbi:MAG: M28 family peptidase [bacterium]
MKIRLLTVWLGLFNLLVGLNPAWGANFDAERAWQHLIAQCEIGPRPPGSDAHRECLKYLEAELLKVCPDVSRQEFLGMNPKTKETLRLTNLVANFQPDRKRRVILGAHWDTRPWADQDSDRNQHKIPIIGANDGASGVAVLLEIGRVISINDPGIGVDIVLFDGEDMGRSGNLHEYCLGSRWYAENIAYPLPEAMILLDMVGDEDLRIPEELYSRLSSPDLLNEIFGIAEMIGEAAFDPQPGSAVYDDHVPFIELGIPAVDLIDFDYPYWHTIQDTPEHCSKSSLASVGRVVLEWLYQRGSR